MTVVVLGGGVGGLSAAYYIQKVSKHKVILLEASSRLGGWIRSHKLPNGLILEEGPRTLRPRTEAGFNTLNLVDDLKLTGNIRSIPISHPASRHRFVFVNGKLHALPANFRALFRKTSPFSKPLISALFHDFKSRPKYVEDDSIYNFVARRFGQEIADYAISPLICGICGGNAKDISVHFLMSEFFRREQQYGSVLKSMMKPWTWSKRKNMCFGSSAQQALKEKWSSFSFCNGMETLPQTLETNILENGAIIKTNLIPQRIDFRKKIIHSNAGELPFDILVSAIPTHSLAKLVYDDHYFHLAKPLLEISYTSIITVHLVFEKPVLKFQGFGFLTPPSENLPILGTIFDTCYAPFENWTVLTVMMGGHSFEKFFSDDCSEETIVKIATENVSKILNIESKPDMHKVAILKNCIPQYVVGHKHRIENIFNYIQQEKLPLFLIGNAFKGTGINDVILSAKETANKVLNFDKKEDEFQVPRYKVEYI